MQNKGLLIGLGVLVAVVVIAFLSTRGGGYQSTQQVPAPGATGVEEKVVTPTGEEATEEAETAALREIEVSGDEYSFSPSTISLAAGETVKITFKNTGSLPHNLTIAELGVATRTIGGGQEDSVTLTPDKAGTYTFYCSVGNHRALGMEGDVTVE